MPLEIRENDPLAAATRAVEELGTNVQQFRSDTEKKLDDRLGSLEKRMDAIDVRNARLAPTHQVELTTDAERCALDLFARSKEQRFAGSEFERELRSLNTQASPDGGWTVLPQLEAGIRNIARDVSPIARLATTRVIGTDSLEILLDPSLAEVGWVGEQQDRPETDGATLKKVSIPVDEMYAAPRAIQKLIDDSSVSVADWLTSRISTGMAIKEGIAFASGSGSG